MEKEIRKENTIRKPKIYFFAVFPHIFLWTFILFYIVFHEARNDGLLVIIPILFFPPIILSAIYVSLLQLNWKIEINKDKVIYRNWFRREKIFGINDLVVVWKNPNRKGAQKWYLYFNFKKITTITEFDENIEILSKIPCHEFSEK